ncbi:phage head completion protein [Prevotella koreensis]
MKEQETFKEEIIMMAGEFKEIIKIFKSIEKENDYGERVIEEKYIYQTRAKHEAISGTRKNENNEIFYDNKKTFYVRSYVPINDTSIIEYDEKKYRVISINKRKEHNDIQVVTELINE